VPFLPLDERPINAAYPRLLAGAVGWELSSPTDLLGSRKKPADTAGIEEWLLSAPTAGAPGAVLALDTLAWGGLIPSRQSGTDLAAALRRLGALRRLKAERPDLKLLAYSSIQRVSRDDDAAEEPDYYLQYGRAIFRRSVLEHRRLAVTPTADETAELDDLRRRIPESVWDDQLAVRGRTAAVNLAALDLVKDGTIDALVLNQDDTVEWGLNVLHRQRLEREVRRSRLEDRVLVYPGADEVGQVLLARLALAAAGRAPRVGSFYSSRRGADVRTAYEDRPLGDLVTVHLRAAGAVQVPPGAPVDLWLALNSPSAAQGQGGVNHALAHAAAHPGALSDEELAALERTEAPVEGLDRSLPAFRATLRALLEDGERVTLADVAHVNGADDVLMTGLAGDGRSDGRLDGRLGGVLGRLSGYGGWNTAGNSLGSAVALGCLAAAGADETKLRLAVVARLVDDWLYQARTRTRLLMDPELKPLGLGGFLGGDQLEPVAERARRSVNDELRAFSLPYRLTRLSFPWRRVFEIDYELVPTDTAELATGTAAAAVRGGAA